jgi:hypothetical protein
LFDCLIERSQRLVALLRAEIEPESATLRAWLDVCDIREV